MRQNYVLVASFVLLPFSINAWVFVCNVLTLMSLVNCMLDLKLACWALVMMFKNMSGQQNKICAYLSGVHITAHTK